MHIIIAGGVVLAERHQQQKVEACGFCLALGKRVRDHTALHQDCAATSMSESCPIPGLCRHQRTGELQRGPAFAGDLTKCYLVKCHWSHTSTTSINSRGFSQFCWCSHRSQKEKCHSIVLPK